MNNPWLQIPAEDYEGHMGSPEVAQSRMIAELFEKTLKNCQPETIAVPGCSTGNGFEKVDWKKIRQLDAIDINPHYLQIARKRFSAFEEKISFKCMDLAKEKLEANKYDLVFAALIFEYVPAETLLSTFNKALKKDGILAVILQMESESHPAVSETKYKSLEKLSSVLRPIKPHDFLRSAEEAGFAIRREDFIKLDSGKSFYNAELAKVHE